MSNSIASQTWELIDATNAAIQEGRRGRKKGEERVAKMNSNVQAQRLASLQQLEKDVILPSDPNDRQDPTAPGNQNVASDKPRLPNPNLSWNAFQGIGDDEPGLIALIGQALALQAKMNSRFWSQMWQQATASMQREVQFAPIIGNAILNAYTAQSKATEAQAESSKWSGIANLMTFGSTILLGGVMEWNDPDNAFKAANDAEGTDKSAPKPADLEEGAQNVKTDTNKLIENTSEETEKSQAKFSGRAKATKNGFMDIMSKSRKFMTEAFGKAVQASMMMNQLSQGLTGYFIENKYQSIQAGWQKQEGKAQALSKECEQYAQFYGQDFSRNEDLRQGSGQNIDYAMNILKSAADTITQTVTAMFRG